MRRALGVSAGCAIALSLAACGGDERQDAGARGGSYEVVVLTASFPEQQSISRPAPLRLVVRNTDDETIPDLAISLQGLSDRNPAPGLADPQQPLWIIDRQPTADATAYDFTWAMGPLAPGATAQLDLRLSPAVAGTHEVTWTVAAGLTGKVVARTPAGALPTGTFTVRVSDQPAAARVDPDTGAVVSAG